jgi:lipid-A-disaccharide synthase
VRYFLSSGEASGELAATLLAQAIAQRDPHAVFEGIGSSRMRDCGIRLWRDNTGWASMGPLAAVPRIPKLLATMLQTASHIAREPFDLVILVDFGAFNVRLAKRLRSLGYAKPILDVFPPGTWLDREKTAREIAAVATPLTAFEHQRDFYESLGLKIAYFGHPLADRYELRPPQPAPAADAGAIALLPGSRSGELRYHLPRLLAAYALLRKARPGLRCVIGASDESVRQRIHRMVAREAIPGATIVLGTRAAIAGADAAFVASGTAVLECALSGVPLVALYVIAPILVKHARRVYPAGKFVTLPNLVLQREAVPELLQEDATPQRLAAQMELVLRDPSRQCDAFATLRRALGPPGALDRAAAYAVELARGPQGH